MSVVICPRWQTAACRSRTARASLPRFPLRSDALVAFMLLASAVLCMMPSPATAQTAYVPGGLFLHQTAFIPREHQLSFYAAAYTWDAPTEGNSSQYPVALSYTPTSRLQVSALAVYHNERDEAPHTHLGGFLKYQIAPDTLRSPAVAISGSYVGRDHFETAIDGAVSHMFRSGGRPVLALHVGVKWIRAPDDEGNGSDFGGFLGAQIPLSREWDLVGESSTRLSIDNASATAFGFMYHNRGGTGITLGFVNPGLGKSLRPFFGVGFPFGR